MRSLRTPIALAALALAVFVLSLRVHEVNRPRGPQFASRTVHLLYLDSLRQELLTFSEQYGRPLFYTDTTILVSGHGRVQAARLREALFDPRVEYYYGDYGFTLDWAGDPKPRRAAGAWVAFHTGALPHAAPGQTPWPESAIEYAVLRRIAITPQWPEPPQRSTRRPANPTPPHHDAFSSLAVLLATH